MRTVAIVKVRDLRPGDYFLMPGACASFMLDADGRFTRLHDAVYLDGSFSVDQHREVVVVDSAVARAAALAYRGA
jgi:hypothetical protein